MSQFTKLKGFRLSEQNNAWLEKMNAKTDQPYTVIINKILDDCRKNKKFKLEKKIYYSERVALERQEKKLVRRNQ